MTEIDVTFRRNSDNTTIQLLQHKLSNMLSNCYISCVFDLREEMSQKKAIVRNVKQTSRNVCYCYFLGTRWTRNCEASITKSIWKKNECQIPYETTKM